MMPDGFPNMAAAKAAASTPELTPAEKDTRRKLARVAINMMKAGADKEMMRGQIVRLNHDLTPPLAADHIAGIADWAERKAGGADARR